MKASRLFPMWFLPPVPFAVSLLMPLGGPCLITSSPAHTYLKPTRLQQLEDDRKCPYNYAARPCTGIGVRVNTLSKCFGDYVNPSMVLNIAILTKASHALCGINLTITMTVEPGMGESPSWSVRFASPL